MHPTLITIGTDQSGNEIQYGQDADGTWTNLHNETGGYTQEWMERHFPQHFGRCSCEQPWVVMVGHQWFDGEPNDDWREVCQNCGLELPALNLAGAAAVATLEELPVGF